MSPRDPPVLDPSSGLQVNTAVAGFLPGHLGSELRFLHLHQLSHPLIPQILEFGVATSWHLYL